MFSDGGLRARCGAGNGVWRPHPALPLSGDARAGHPRIALARGYACRISTGGALPIGCDIVVVREFASIEAGTARLDLPIIAGQHMRRRGEDIVAGALVVGDQTVITPEIVRAMACYGIDTVRVARDPRLILLSTGDELAGAADAADPVRTPDANSPMIAAMAAQLGIVGERLPVVGVDPGLVRRGLEAAMARVPSWSSRRVESRRATTIISRRCW